MIKDANKCLQIMTLIDSVVFIYITGLVQIIIFTHNMMVRFVINGEEGWMAGQLPVSPTHTG